MNIKTKIADGEVRIDYEAYRIVNGGLKEIYNCLVAIGKTSKCLWQDAPLLLKRGIVIGCYNQFITPDSMAELGCSRLVKLITDHEDRT